MREFKFFMVIVVVLSVISIGNIGHSKEPDEYVIGGMQALSGPGHSAVIDNIVKGANLAVAEINRAGGVQGKPMKLIWEDHKAKGPDGVSAFLKLISINHVPVATTGYTAPTMACAPIADQKKTLLINTGAYGPSLSSAGKFLFHLPANELIMIKCMLDYAKKHHEIKKIGLIYVNDDMGLSVKKFLEKYCKDVGIELAGSEAFAMAATDYSAQIEKAKRWGVDAIYASVHRHPALIKQSEEKNFKPLWIGCPFYTYGEFLTQSGTALKGAIAASADSSLDRNPGLVKLKAAWEKEYGNDSWPTSMIAYLGYAYDFPYLAKTLIEYGKGKKWDDYFSGEKLRQALIETNSFQGCMGEISFDIDTGLSYRNVELFEAVPSSSKPGEFEWKSTGYYTADEIKNIGK